MYALVELVGVDVRAEYLQTGLFIRFQQRRTRESDQDGIWH